MVVWGADRGLWLVFNLEIYPFAEAICSPTLDFRATEGATEASFEEGAEEGAQC